MHWILHKVNINDPFTRIPNELLQREDLTYEARGLLTELLSRPQNWVIQRTQLLRNYAKDEKLRRITQELRDAGFMYLHETQDNETGHFVRRWLVSDTPLTVDEYQEICTKRPAQPDGPYGLARPRSAQLGQTPIVQINDTLKKNEVKIAEEQNSPATPVLPKIDFKKRWVTESLPYKLADLLITLVQKRRPGQNARFLASEEGRYLLIQKNAKHFDLLLERDKRDINEVLEVLQWSQEDSFWRDNIRSGESFRRQYTVLTAAMREKGIGSMRVDHNPELTQQLIGTYRALIANPSFHPSPAQHTKFIVGAERMTQFFRKVDEVDRSMWCECLRECLEKNYLDNSQNVYPGNFCSDHTWQVLMPQYLLDAGLVMWEEQEAY